MKLNKIEKIFYKHLENEADADEVELLKREMASSEELRKTSRQVNKIREMLENNPQPSFKPFFEERLMSKINSLSANDKTGSLANSLAVSFRQVALTAIIILVILISFNLNNGNKYSLDNLLGKSGAGIEYAFSPVDNLLGSSK